MVGAGRLELGPVSRPVVVAVEDRELAERLARAFGAPRPEPLGSSSPAVRVSGSAGGGFAIDGDVIAARSFADLVERLDGLVDRAVADDTGRDFLLLHASAVEDPPGRALVFIGSSGAGKSTHAGLFALEGSAFLGDECLAVAFDPPRIVPWRRPLALRSDVVRWLDRHPERAGRSVVLATERKRYLPAAELPLPLPVEPVPIGCFVWLDRLTEHEGAAESNELFRMLLAGCHCFGRDGATGFPRLAELARSVPVVRLRATGELAGVEHVRKLVR